MKRRTFLGALAAPAFCPSEALFSARAGGIVRDLASHAGSASALAGDEDFWREVQAAYTVDRSMVYLNNAGIAPAPRAVQAAHARHLSVANDGPAYTMWRLQDPKRETVRAHIARVLGAHSEEVALTRNASEGLQICQFGMQLSKGDEVLTTTQDYPRMINAFRQRERRDGIQLRQVAIPVPLTDPAELVRRFEAAITERTRLILCCHVVNLTGQVLPAADIVALGRRRGIPVIVDGAHSFAHFPFERKDLGCDYYATSLHKWLGAPIGTGMLFVARERVQALWPLMAADDSLSDDIRKFEQFGTHPIPLQLAIADALAFHEGLGIERKAARLVHLRDRWVTRLAADERFVMNTDLSEGRAYGIANFALRGISTKGLAQYLWRKHRIYAIRIEHEDFEGLRVSPNVYTSIEEIDRFCAAVETVMKEGLPA